MKLAVRNDEPQTNADSVAGEFFGAVQAYIDKRLADMEARVKVLEILDARRSKSATRYERDQNGEIIRSIRGEE